MVSKARSWAIRSVRQSVSGSANSSEHWMAEAEAEIIVKADGKENLLAAKNLRYSHSEWGIQ